MLTKQLSLVLVKAQIISFLGLPQKSKENKEDLIIQLLALIDSNPYEKERLFNMFPRELAVGPTELEQLLHCSSLERKRWVKEGRIPILEYRTFRKAGQNLLYPVHDRRLIFKLSQEEIQQWRRGECVCARRQIRLLGRVLRAMSDIKKLLRPTP